MAFYYKKFKSLRKDIGMSQLEVGQKLGLAKSTIAMYESGKRTPDFETIEAICDLFNVNMSELSDSKLATKYENLNTVQIAPHIQHDNSKKTSVVYKCTCDVQPQALHEQNINVSMCGIEKNIKKDKLELNMTFTEKLQKALTKSGMTRSELADKAGISRPMITNYLKGNYKAKQNNVLKLAKALNIPESDLIEDEPFSATTPAELPELTAKDERDIVKEIEDIIQHVDTTAAVGGEMTPEGEDKELLKSSLTQAVTLAKRIAKQKYTPKKYRK